MWTRFNPLHSPDCRPAAPLAAGVVESQGSTGQMPPAEVERRNENIASNLTAPFLTWNEIVLPTGLILICRHFCSPLPLKRAEAETAGVTLHCRTRVAAMSGAKCNIKMRKSELICSKTYSFSFTVCSSCIADFSPIFGPACCAQASQTTNMKWKHRAGFQDMSGRAIENGRNDGTPASTLIVWLPTLLSRLKTYGRLTPELPQTSRCWLAWFRTPSVASNSKFSGNTLID